MSPVQALQAYRELPTNQRGVPHDRHQCRSLYALIVNLRYQSQLCVVLEGITGHSAVHYPGRSDGTHSLVLFHPASAFPCLRWVGSCIALFRGLLSVYSRYGLHARQVAYATSYTRGSDGLRFLHRCSDCYRVERTGSRAGLSPLWTNAFHGAPQTCAI